MLVKGIIEKVFFFFKYSSPGQITVHVIFLYLTLELAISIFILFYNI